MLNCGAKEYGFIEGDSQIPASCRLFMYSELMEYMNKLNGPTGNQPQESGGIRRKRKEGERKREGAILLIRSIYRWNTIYL